MPETATHRQSLDDHRDNRRRFMQVWRENLRHREERPKLLSQIARLEAQVVTLEQRLAACRCETAASD